jgi:polar amino acid transport system substrate-binding protein
MNRCLAPSSRPSGAIRMAAALLTLAGLCGAVSAQNATPAGTSLADQRTSPPGLPNQFDPHLRLPVAQIAAATPIRFLTEDDYPPFQITGPDGSLTGFNIDLARALCADLAHQCTIQPRRWDTLLDALASRAGDAVIAGMRASPEILARADVTYPYLKTPGRFVARRDRTLIPSPRSLAGHTVAVTAGTAHEAFIKAFFPAATSRSFNSTPAVFDALARGEADVAFVDGPSAASWLNGATGACCAFVGGPYFENRFFGEGMIIAVRKGDDAMRRVLNQSLQRLSQNGRLGDLYLKYFPVGFY